MHLQLPFFLLFFNDPNVDLYFELRNSKYSNRDKILPHFCEPSYFANWLGGFIESEGSFTNRSSGTSSFSIAQNQDYSLIQAIRDFYGAHHLTISNKVGKISGYPLYEVSIASLAGVTRVISHCIPLLQGYKYYQLVEFITKSKTLRSKV